MRAGFGLCGLLWGGGFESCWRQESRREEELEGRCGRRGGLGIGKRYFWFCFRFLRRGVREHGFGYDAGFFHDVVSEGFRFFGVVTHKFDGGIASLSDAFFAVREPRSAFFDHIGGNTEIDEFPEKGDSASIKDVEVDDSEGWCDFIFYDFDFGLVSDDVFFFLDGTDASDVESHACVEFEGVSSGGGFRAPKHDADFHTDLVDEDDHAVSAFDISGEFSQSLAHESGLSAYVGVAHFAFEFGSGYEGGNGIDNEDIEGS